LIANSGQKIFNHKGYRGKNENAGLQGFSVSSCTQGRKTLTAKDAKVTKEGKGKIKSLATEDTEENQGHQLSGFSP
jgi:hypothetical protein